MALPITIENYGTIIKFHFASPYKTPLFTANKGSTDFQLRHDGLIEVTFGNGGASRTNTIWIDWEKVESPSVASADDLMTVLTAYANSYNINNDVVNLVTGASQLITFPTAFVDANDITIVWNDMDGVGFDAPSLITASGFTVTNILGNGRMSYIAIKV
jgi:hypothetical protein